MGKNTKSSVNVNHEKYMLVYKDLILPKREMVIFLGIEVVMHYCRALSVSQQSV